MGCFLACFGFKKKKKSRRPGKKSQNHGSYVPLDSEVSIKLDIKENNITSDSYQLKDKPKEPSISIIKKKVSFNLNVKAYEPIPNDDDDDDTSNYLCEGEEGTQGEFNIETKSLASLHYEDDSNSIATTYRYQNCRDSYDDEDDELKFEEDDLIFDENEDTDLEDDEDVESDNEVLNNQIPEEENRSPDLQNKELEGLGSKFHGRDRSRHVFSVLNPVENLTQWKFVKAKAAAGQLKCQKENLMEGESFLGTTPNLDSSAFEKIRNVSQPSEHIIAVDASLSNWNTRNI